ncbi:MAG: hypothetical protein M3R59_06570 [Verrucomicrobiota bacterium]|nr:hypothetical protein [Verrucomicrobiota bacterium]
MHEIFHAVNCLLPPRTADALKTEAKILGIDAGSLATAVLCDFFDSPSGEAAAGTLRRPVPSAGPRSSAQTLPSRDFSAALDFDDYPPLSIQLTQDFVNTALQIGGVRVYRRGRSIVFMPRFAAVEYPISRRGALPGLVVNFYGRPDQFDDPQKVLYRGPNSYVRARIHTPEQLHYCQSFLAQAYENRFGSRGGKR